MIDNKEIDEVADRFLAQIWIGGKISRTALLYPNDAAEDTTILQGLIGALHNDGAADEFGNPPIPANFDPPSPDNCVVMPLSNVGWANCVNDSGILNLKCDQAVNGEFPETEAFCIEHDISFDRWSNGHYGKYDAETVYFRPGMNSPVRTYADSAGKELIDGDTARQAMEKLDAFNNVVGSSQWLSADDWLNFITGLRLLHDACSKFPPKLETFEVIA